MSSTNKTTNLELSQFLGSDSPKWLTDYNSDMEKIDAGYQTVKAQADATDLVVGGHTSSMSSLQSTVSEQGTAISGLRTDVTANSGSINTINSLIGNGEPTTTDKTLIGAINELAAEMPSPTTQLPATSITYNNTNSGLSATSAQGAIDELAEDIAETVYSHLGSPVDLTRYSASNLFTAPHNGYIKCYVYAETGRFATGIVHDTNVDLNIRAIGVTGTQAQYVSLYVEKGMKLYGAVDSVGGSYPSTAQYIPCIRS